MTKTKTIQQHIQYLKDDIARQRAEIRGCEGRIAEQQLLISESCGKIDGLQSGLNRLEAIEKGTGE